ncbi:IS110 family transposase [Spirosoma soli]|uniref:IS110 family transposase n=1 Tax=Spirosoma soli TaxID=1770529 RepID=A0ABW5M7X9_9BACT
MNHYKYFVGLDLGKTTNAICVLDEQENRCFELKLPNTQQGMQTLLEKLDTLAHFEPTSVLICAEYTSVYCQPLIGFFGGLGADLWLQSAVHIKHSLGLKRGKTDKADARLIAKYCLRHQADKRLFVLTESTLSVLRQLAQQRERLLEMVKSFTDLASDYKAMGLSEALKLHQQTSEVALAGLRKQLQQVEARIEAHIKACPELKTNMALLMSIPGVGRQTAMFMLIFTANFTRFDDPKKLASYAGVAPFAYESGTSVRGKTKVSRMANTKLKHLLHMAALGAVRVKGEMRQYFEQKVAQGKKKMSVYNAIRNKLVHRMVAVMDRRTPYVAAYAK